jgi:hypothetical protein
MKKHAKSIIAMCLVFVGIFAFAQIPETMSYQGFLTDNSGNEVTGSVNFLFKLYESSTAGTAIWQENHLGVAVENGIFSVILENLGSLEFDTQYWMGISINGGAELTPRVKLTSTAYSLNTASIPDNIVTPQKINTSGASADQALVYNGTNLTWSSVSGGGLTLPYNVVYDGGGYAIDMSSQGTGGLLNLSVNSSSSANVINAFIDGTGKAGRFDSNSSSADHCLTVDSWSNTKSAFEVTQNGSARAAEFYGNVQINGTIEKSSGSFKIDHPLDPANKYLYHSFVESPDMMNVYNGNIITNNEGLAEVQLPDYFEALNKDFRYQLTCIGDFSQAIIYDKISNNSFMIKTEKPNIEVSWQITGIRKDPYAENNRIKVEVEKPDNEKGYYLHYEEYNQPKEKSIRVAIHPEEMINSK